MRSLNKFGSVDVDCSINATNFTINHSCFHNERGCAIYSINTDGITIDGDETMSGMDTLGGRPMSLYFNSSKPPTGLNLNGTAAAARAYEIVIFLNYDMVLYTTPSGLAISV